MSNIQLFENLGYISLQDNNGDYFLDKAELYTAVIESAGDSIMTTTLEGVITGWNPAAEKLYGYTAEEVIGRSIEVIAPKIKCDEIGMITDKIRKGSQVEKYETILISKYGKIIDISLTVSPIRTEDGQLIGASAIARDITPRKVLQRKLHKVMNDLEKIFNAFEASEIVQVLDDFESIS